MEVLKITMMHEDGTLAFEGVFPPEEAKFILEMGVNVLLRNGALSTMDEEEDDDEDPFEELDETTSNRH